jgi:hypothetical protein
MFGWTAAVPRLGEQMCVYRPKKNPHFFFDGPQFFWMGFSVFLLDFQVCFWMDGLLSVLNGLQVCFWMDGLLSCS